MFSPIETHNRESKNIKRHFNPIGKPRSCYLWHFDPLLSLWMGAPGHPDFGDKGGSYFNCLLIPGFKGNWMLQMHPD